MKLIAVSDRIIIRFTEVFPSPVPAGANWYTSQHCLGVVESIGPGEQEVREGPIIETAPGLHVGDKVIYKGSGEDRLVVEVGVIYDMVRSYDIFAKVEA